MRRALTLPALLITATLFAACSGTSSSAYRTSSAAGAPFRGDVRVYATYVPPGAQAVGVVEVSSVDELEQAVAAFKQRVAELGGDLGVVDRYSHSFEIVTSSRTESYSCGTQQSPRTCSRSVTDSHEVTTLHLSGRAMITGRAP